MNMFNLSGICGDFPISGFLIFVVMYTVVCASIIGTWKYGVYKRPALDMIASMICGLLMSLLIILSFLVVENQKPTYNEQLGDQYNEQSSYHGEQNLNN